MIRSEKTRLLLIAIKATIRVLVIFILTLIAMAIIVSITAMAAVNDCSTENSARNTVSKSEGTKLRVNNRVEFVSTMQLVAQKKEKIKGDKSKLIVKLAKKEAAEKKAKEKAKKEALKNAEENVADNWLQTLDTPENRYILEHLCTGEAVGESNECQQAVILVVLNRVKSNQFPDTIKEVVFAHKQYACTYDGNYEKKPTKRVKDNVDLVLTGKATLDMPEDVVYQAQFTQGSGVWRQIGTEIFCHY